MIQYTTSDKRKKIILFSLIILAIVGIIALLMGTLWQKKIDKYVDKNRGDSSPSVSIGQYNTLLVENEGLAIRLNALQQLDNQYADQLTEIGSKKKLDSINQLIYIQEEIFRESIDSIFLNSSYVADSNFNKFSSNIISFYKSMLGNRHAVSSLRSASSFDKTGFSKDEISVLKTQRELQKKNSRIDSLEHALKSIALNNKNIVTPSVAYNEKMLPENTSLQQSNIEVLTKTNNVLKQDNDKLIKQLRDATGLSNLGEITFKNKVTGLQQKVDQLNAELRLARVDCNLSRVDATQIISSAKQRKQLLSEASSILTSLTDADDAAIKKKVQDKIIQLNQVTANSRD